MILALVRRVLHAQGGGDKIIRRFVVGLLLAGYSCAGCHLTESQRWDVVALLDISGPSQIEGCEQWQTLQALWTAYDQQLHVRSGVRLHLIDTKGDPCIAQKAALKLSKKGDITCTPRSEYADCILDAAVACHSSESLQVAATENPARPSTSTSPYYRQHTTSLGGVTLIGCEIDLDIPRTLAIIGPNNSGEARHVADTLARLGEELPLLLLAASRNVVWDKRGNLIPFAFKFAADNEVVASRIARAMVANGDRDIIQLRIAGQAFARQGAVAFQDFVSSQRGRIGSSSKRSLLTLTPQQAIKLPPTEQELIEASGWKSTLDSHAKSANAVLIWGTQNVDHVVRYIAEYYPDLRIYLTHYNGSKSFLARAGLASEGAIVVGYRILRQPRFLDPESARDIPLLSFQRFLTSRLGRAPSPYDAFARDAFEVLMRGMDRLREEPSVDLTTARSILVENLQRDSEILEGAAGIFTFSESDHGGPSEDAVEAFRVTRGEFVPFDQSDGELGVPPNVDGRRPAKRQTDVAEEPTR